MREPFIYEVKIDTGGDLNITHDMVETFMENDIRPNRDYEINMHGGWESYTSFYFKDADLAMRIKLTYG